MPGPTIIPPSSTTYEISTSGDYEVAALTAVDVSTTIALYVLAPATAVSITNYGTISGAIAMRLDPGIAVTVSNAASGVIAGTFTSSIL